MSWGAAGAACPSERESGDQYIVQPSAPGVLIAAVDGAGHGSAAAAAARVAASTLTAHAAESPIGLVLRCHRELRRMRGVVMTLAFVHLREQTLTWLGVGNVEAVLIPAARDGAAPRRALLRSGLVGYQLPALRVEVVSLTPLDTLVMATDGINAAFADALPLDRSPQQIADHVLANHWKGTDDGLVLVARYLRDGRS